jgi:hypothetical protein
LIRLDEGDRLTGVERVESLGDEFGNGDGEADSPSMGGEAP